jgi:hemoglobin/transferrin/lactoferrin receptor protein
MSRSWNNSLLLSASVLTLCGAGAHAQQISLEPIVVRTPLDGTVVTTTRAAPPQRAAVAPAPAPAPQTSSASPSNASSAAVVPSSASAAPSAIESLSGASALDRGQIAEQYQPGRVSEVLRNVPGVTIQETARDPGVAVNVRGLQDFGRVNVLVDGVRQNFQRSGHSANGVFYFDPEMIKRVDVTRGPTATVYGSGAIGGVVAFEVLDADDVLRGNERAGVRVKTVYQTNGEGPLGSATAAARAGGFDILGQFNSRQVDDYRDGAGNRIQASANDTDSALVRARWRQNGHMVAGTFIDYHAGFIDAAANTPSVTLPATLTRRDSDLHNQQMNIGYSFARPDTPLLDLQAKIYRNETDLEQRKLNNANAGTLRGFNLVTEGFDVSNTSRFDFGWSKLALTYGGDAFRDVVSTFDRDPTGNADELTPGGRREVGGAFLQSHWRFGPYVDLIGAIRYDTYSVEGGAVELDGSRVSPKATLGVTPIPGITVFATYAEGYRAPAITETLIAGFHPGGFAFRLLPNPNLRPEVAQNVEGGINLKYDGVVTAGDVFRAKATIFQNKVEDFIAGVFSPLPPPFGQFQYQNIANVTLDGVELEAAYDARRWFFGIAASRIRGTDDATGLPVNTIPADKLTLTGGVRLLDDTIVLGSRVRAVAAQDRVTTASLKTDGFTVVDLFATYKHSEDVSFSLNIDNVADKSYRQFLDQSSSPGLNARLGFTMRLGTP